DPDRPNHPDGVGPLRGAWLDAGIENPAIFRRITGRQASDAHPGRKIALIIGQKPDRVIGAVRVTLTVHPSTVCLQGSPEMIAATVSEAVAGERKLHSHDNKTALFNLT
ncbi:MAG: hypothetical protein VW495_07890, partial [Rhodobiaceae bacterium]